MARNYYQIAIHHPGLCKHRVIRGADRYLVEAAAATQQRAWAEQYAKKLDREERRRTREEHRRALEWNQEEADERTKEAESTLSGLRGLLQATLRVNDEVNWATMMQPSFSEDRPKERPYLPLPKEPTFDPNEWRQRKNFVTALIPFLARRAEATARAEFDAAHAKWLERKNAAKATNEKIYAENLRDFEEWRRRSIAYEESRAKHNTSVEQSRAAYQALNPDAILDYCDLVLSRSQYPDCFPKEFELDYEPRAKTLVVEYQLPAPDDLPRLKSVKYVSRADEFVETELTKREFEQLYSDVVFQVLLRTIHELFEADVVRAIDAIAINGEVNVLNAGTGHREDRCIASARVGRASFETINLRNIDPRACFESLGGLAGTRILDCRAVKPVAAINRNDERFTAAEDVTGNAAAGLSEWQELLKTIADPQEIRFLQVATVMSLLGFPAKEKLSIAMSEELAEAVAARGCAIEPDTRYGAAGYRSDDEVALFRPLPTPITGAYPGAAALLQLCVVIAAADDHPTENELEVARGFIHQNIELTSQEQQRLLVLEHYLCRNPEAGKRSLARLVKRLPTAKRHLVGEVLVCVAGADGIISSGEWSVLERTCNMLDLPAGALDQILRKLGATFEEPLVQEAQPAAPGEPIPATQPRSETPSFRLDMSRVAAISHETAEVIGILSEVMREDESKIDASAPVVSASIEPPASTGPVWLDSLESKYQAFATRVITKPTWSRAEFQQLAAEFKLMPLGALDILNEWADEQFGDFLLEGDDPLTVNTSILPRT